MKSKKNIKKSWIKNGIFVLIALTLYLTGYHTEVIGFLQRGVLATGLLNPNVDEIIELKNNNETITDLNINLIDVNGKTKSLSALKGKVIFMNYWATWCPPCIAEMPSIVKLHKEMGNDVAFVMLAFDKDFEKAKEFNKRKGYNLPIYALGSNLPEAFKSSALPTTFVIDKKGNLVLTHKGMADYNSNKFKNFMKSLQ